MGIKVNKNKDNKDRIIDQSCAVHIGKKFKCNIIIIIKKKAYDV
jgi:hypothetical protein